MIIFFEVYFQQGTNKFVSNSPDVPLFDSTEIRLGMHQVCKPTWILTVFILFEIKKEMSHQFYFWCINKLLFAT